MKIEEPFFTLKIRPGLTAEQWQEVASALCRIAIDPPRSMVERRRVAVRTAMNLHPGAPTRRAKMLERQYRSYLAGAWLRERDLETLPEFLRTPKRTCLHRLARCNGGASLSWRRIFDIAHADRIKRCGRCR